MARADGIAGRHLLLVEPHDDTRSNLRAFFQTFGIRVTEAREHLAAGRAVAAQPADILLVDLDGASAELVRRARYARPAPVVAVAMGARAGEQAAARGAGFDVFVRKPFDPAELLIELVQRLHR